jgi:hypothetical protein
LRQKKTMSDEYSNQNSFLGLGYHSQRHNSYTIDSIINDQSSNPSTTVSTFSVDFILQQCLQYHQEQEYVRQQQQNDQKSVHLQDKSELNVTNTEDLSQIGSKFVAATRNDVDYVEISCIAPNQNYFPHEPEINFDENAILNQVQEPPGSIDYISEEINQCRKHEQPTVIMEEKINQARAIISRLNKEREDMLMNMTNKTRNSVSSNDNIVDDTLLTLPPSLYAEQRQIAFEKEKIRLQDALLRNYEYVQKKDDERIRILEKKVKESEIFEQAAAEQYSQKLMIRQQRIKRRNVRK